MTTEWTGLAETVKKLTASIKSELDRVNDDFHNTLNGARPLKFNGIGSSGDDPVEYSVELSDVLFWHDPTGYLDELERWQNQSLIDQYQEVKDYLEETDQNTSFSRLVEAIKRKRIVPFIGAGLSFSCDYPLWEQAITKLAKKLEGVSTSETRAMQPALSYLEEVKQYIVSSKYLDAVQLLYENNKTQVDNFINNTFDGADAKDISGPIKLLPAICDGCIITTNFDGLIEKVFQQKHKAIEGYMHGIQTHNQFAAKLIQGDRCLLKLHGHYNSPETYIFSREQYAEAYGDQQIDYTKPLAKVLRQIFISHSMLFLGCSLEQDRTTDLFSDIITTGAFDIPRHFALMPEIKDHQEKLEKETKLLDTKIQPIWYQVLLDDDGREDHSQLELMIKFAIACAEGKL
ncbi:SIR2 family protein [Endozoicomonas acroporae]|uniref:SIR2 family protein n=1 Tax=Endozoicomonas acroporae TaxID=1701104 RepID=UPI0013CF6926|nr:SIR2 family protein [Endozoicomonas acroporae]